jgi:hypothetical protein
MSWVVFLFLFGGDGGGGGLGEEEIRNLINFSSYNARVLCHLKYFSLFIIRLRVLSHVKFSLSSYLFFLFVSLCSIRQYDKTLSSSTLLQNPTSMTLNIVSLRSLGLRLSSSLCIFFLCGILL